MSISITDMVVTSSCSGQVKDLVFVHGNMTSMLLQLDHHTCGHSIPAAAF